MAVNRRDFLARGGATAAAALAAGAAQPAVAQAQQTADAMGRTRPTSS